MSYDTDEQPARRQFGPIGKTLLALTAIGALFLLYHAAWFAVTMVGLAHDVPSPWTISDFSLIALPVTVLAVLLAAIYALVRGRLMPLWICLGYFAFDLVVIVSSE
jgi:hypothetical protein